VLQPRRQQSSRKILHFSSYKEADKEITARVTTPFLRSENDKLSVRISLLQDQNEYEQNKIVSFHLINFSPAWSTPINFC
jgi:hypothetical protein